MVTNLEAILFVLFSSAIIYDVINFVCNEFCYFITLAFRLPELIGTGIPNKANSASFTLHNRNKVGSHDEDLGKTPGPAAYSATDNNLVYNRRPRWTMSARAKNMSALMKNPAPNAYGPRGFVDRKTAPKFSMGIKHSEYCMPLIIDAWD